MRSRRAQLPARDDARRQDIPHALHVFSKGPHSLGLARGAGEPSAWTELAEAWLNAQLDRVTPGGR
jgi:hypothetical protein